MKIAIVFGLLGLAGCSILSGTLTPQHLAPKASYELCDMYEAIFQSPENKQVILKEIERRGYDCGNYIAQKRANIGSALTNFSNYYNNKLQSDREYYQLNKPTICTGHWVGNFYQTTCQ